MDISTSPLIAIEPIAVISRIKTMKFNKVNYLPGVQTPQFTDHMPVFCLTLAGNKKEQISYSETHTAASFAGVNKTYRCIIGNITTLSE
jgi:hypothetical protein